MSDDLIERAMRVCADAAEYGLKDDAPVWIINRDDQFTIGDLRALLALTRSSSSSELVEALDIDALMLAMLKELHANVPEDQRPMALCDLSDEQADRARKAVRAVIVGACLSKPAGRHASIAELEATLSKTISAGGS